MDTAWLAAWLAFVHLDKLNAPAPGPCRNNRLIEWDAVQGKYVGRHGLMMSSKNWAGDFRRVSRETWLKFNEFYPDSGPAITIEYNPTMNNGEETYIGKHFVILDPPPAPKVTISKSKKKKALKAAAAAKAAEEAAIAAAAAEAEAKERSASSATENNNIDAESDFDAKSEYSMSISSSISMSTTTRNQPRVVSNLPPPPPGVARNAVAEQFALRAMEKANEDTMRSSERSHSISSQYAAGRHPSISSTAGLSVKDGVGAGLSVSPPSATAMPKKGTVRLLNLNYFIQYLHLSLTLLPNSYLTYFLLYQ